MLPQPVQKIIYVAILFFLTCITAQSQTYKYENGNWYINGKFKRTTLYCVNGTFSFKKPVVVDSTINLNNGYCIPPFGDAHTHNFDGTYNLKELLSSYLKEGVFYVQVLGNYGSRAEAVRPVLSRAALIDVTYANGLLTATYGHGFWPYEPLALGYFNPRDQIKNAAIIKKSRLAENDAYFFCETIEDVESKWPIVMKYKPDHIKICLLDALNFKEKRRAEVPDSYGLSPDIAVYIVKKAHAQGLRVFAHVETADDARLCVSMGVDALAHMPGYSWNGKEDSKEKYCMTLQDVKLFKKANLTVIPTMNSDYSGEVDSNGNGVLQPERAAAVFAYKKQMLRAMYKSGVNLALGADVFGRTVRPEIDSLIKYEVFKNNELLYLYAVSTPQSIFPGRKIGFIKEGYEASFLVLPKNPLNDISAIYEILQRVRKGKFIKIK
jgi:imidazolonepropionase-like amidohydrolase